MADYDDSSTIHLLWQRFGSKAAAIFDQSNYCLDKCIFESGLVFYLRRIGNVFAVQHGAIQSR